MDEMRTRSLARLLRPRSIAVIGGKPATEVVRQLHRMEFAGEIWPVHPRHERIEDRRAFPSVSDLPSPPDAVFLAVNRHLTVEMVDELSCAGAGGVVAYASGFAETGPEGAALQSRLRDAAGDMPVFGPNCYGLINYLDGALLWPDQHGGQRVQRGVAIVTQSGNIGLNMTMQRRGLPIAYLVTMGNQAVVGLSAAIESLAEDPRVTAIGLHIEGIDDPTAFALACVRARERSVQLVVLKTGGSAAGAQLTVSHTASLAGADAVVDAFLAQLGVARVTSVPVLLETLKLLHVSGPMRGGDIASMSCSGGEAALIADCAEGRRVRFRPLDAAQAGAVRATLDPLVTVSNPLDYHTFSWANREAMAATFAAMMRAGYDMTALILDYPRTDRCSDADWAAAADALIAAHATTGRPAAVISTLPETMPEDRALALAEAGVVPLCGLDDALSAMEAARAVHHAGEPPLTPGMPAGEAEVLDEWRSKQMLAAYGVEIPDARRVDTPNEAIRAASDIGLPVVVKAVSSALTHKSEHNAVRLGLRDQSEVATAASELRPLGDALLVEAMVTEAVAEVIVGIDRDPAIGPYLVLGSGGILAELVRDRVVLTLPADAATIRNALGSLRVAALLAGYRGRPPGDVDALVQTVLAIQRFAIDHLDRLLELDVNPVMVRPSRLGAVAADALVRMIKDNRI
jgi:acyl-CoA synthetase (NDP forming)